MRLLSVDWDFFFPVPEFDKELLYDWGHNENYGSFNEVLWTARAAAFLRSGKPLPQTSEEELRFWPRFNFSREAVLYYADSHSAIFKSEVTSGVTEVWNFDAHHDAYRTVREVQTRQSVDCSDWAVGFFLNRVKVFTFFPTWRAWAVSDDKPKVSLPKAQVDPGKRFRKVFDRVFVCRSGTWTPTWIEEEFWHFVESCPVSKHVNLSEMTVRDFDLEAVGVVNAQVDEAYNSITKYKQEHGIEES